MPDYCYKARDDAGRLVSGTMSADSTDELTSRLRKMGYMAVSVAPAAAKANSLRDISDSLLPVRLKDLTAFSFKLSNMLNSGLSILTSLRAIESQTGNRRLKAVTGDLCRQVEAGALFSEGLSKHPRVFDRFLVNMVKAGEESGKLNEVLRRYSLFLDEKQDLQEKIKGALFYPALLLLFALIVILFMVTFVIPQFADLFLRSKITLPAITQALFVLGLGLKKYAYLVILGMVAAVFLLAKYIATKKGRYQLDVFLLRLPVIGSLLRKICVCRFAQTLALLLSSGVAVLQSLDIVKEVIGNEVMAGALAKTREAAEAGEKISGSLRVSGEFPLDAVEMTAVGEESGDLDGALNKLGDFYNKETSYAIKRLTILIEPLFLAVIGGIVGFIMLAVLLPIFEMVKILR